MPPAGFDAAKVYFKTGFGLVLNSKPDGNSFTLTLPAGKTNEGYELFAYMDVNGKPQILGKLDVLTFPFVHQKVCLVPVKVTGSEPIIPDADKVSDELNSIYNPFAVEFEVTVADSIYNNQNAWDYDNDGKLDITGTGLFSNLSSEMKALAISYRIKLDSVYDNTKSYLFVLNDSKSDADSQQSPKGDMPRGHQFGYLFGAVDARTLAHELGHGLFKLKHTFDPDYKLDQGTTQNLMDYAGGSYLTQTQWRSIHDPGLVIGVFESDGDALDIETYNVSEDQMEKIGIFPKLIQDQSTDSKKCIFLINSPWLTGIILNDIAKSRIIDLKYMNDLKEKWQHCWTQPAFLNNKAVIIDGQQATHYEAWIKKLNLNFNSNNIFIKDLFFDFRIHPFTLPNQILQISRDWLIESGIEIWGACYTGINSKNVEYRRLCLIDKNEIINTQTKITTITAKTADSPDYLGILQHIDAFGYNIEGNINASISSYDIGVAGGTLRAGITTVVFKRGPYSYQPLKYFYVGAANSKAISTNLTPRITFDAGVGFSLFVARCHNSSIDQPDYASWEEYNDQTSKSASLKFSVGYSYFKTKPFDLNTSWEGLSLDIGASLGFKKIAKYSAGSILSAEDGITYSKCLESNPQETSLVEWYVKIAKWYDFFYMSHTTEAAKLTEYALKCIKN